MKNKVKPTRLQKATVEILAENPAIPISKAMKQAGYSEKTSIAPGNNFLDLEGTKIAIEEFKDKLRGQGINEDFMAKKYAELIDAKKVKTSLTEPDRVVPDYQTQLAAKDDINKILGLITKQEGVKRKVTFEEFFDK